MSLLDFYITLNHPFVLFGLLCWSLIFSVLCVFIVLSGRRP